MGLGKSEHPELYNRVRFEYLFEGRFLTHKVSRWFLLFPQTSR